MKLTKNVNESVWMDGFFLLLFSCEIYIRFYSLDYMVPLYAFVPLCTHNFNGRGSEVRLWGCRTCIGFWTPLDGSDDDSAAE